MASTIFALSSGSPPSAIAVLRISGTESESALRQLTQKHSERFKPFRMFYTPIFDKEGRLLDRVMACFMKGPKTFTGEDSAELYVHGSRAVIDAVCATLAGLEGLEPARAGEFTRRAFYNGKMNAAEVEALGDLINAQSEAQLRLSHAQSKVGEYLHPLRERLVKFRAKMEARIDFAEDLGDIEHTLEEEFKDDLNALSTELRHFLRSASRGQLIRSGMNVALIGRPNVGKSSLMNRLAERDIAITSNISGTTRDCLEARLHLGKQLVTVVDTAGIRTDSNDPLEVEGIRRTLRRASEAHLIILVLDSNQMGKLKEEEKIRKEMQSLLDEFSYKPEEQILIVCLNKMDLLEEDLSRSKWLEQCLNPDRNLTLVWTCCIQENGLDSLLQTISSILTKMGSNDLEGNEPFLSRERHIQCLEMALENLEGARNALNKWNDPAMAAFFIDKCFESVGEIAGFIVPEQVLDSIFSQFCIGK